MGIQCVKGGVINEVKMGFGSMRIVRFSVDRREGKLLVLSYTDDQVLNVESKEIERDECR